MYQASLLDEFKDSMKEWVELKTVLKNARADLKDHE